MSDDLKGPKVKYKLLLGPPHSTTPAAVKRNKNIKVGFFNGSENIQNNESGPGRPFSINKSFWVDELAMKSRESIL